MTARQRLLAAAVAAATLCAACAQMQSQPTQTLRGSDAATPDTAPQVLAYAGGRPGGGTLVPRTFAGQPPVIPHSVANYEEISTTDNPCLECHITDEFKGKKMPRVPDNHLVPGKKDADGNGVLEMARWQCNTCHVPQVDAKPLVDNAFVGATKR